jgi:GGDEF domain-containing protein
LCQAVNECAPVLAGRPFAAGTISVSVGGTCAVVNRSATLREQSLLDLDAGEALFRAADTALYLAKASGRNRAWVNDGGAPNGSSNCPDEYSPKGAVPGQVRSTSSPW